MKRRFFLKSLLVFLNILFINNISNNNLSRQNYSDKMVKVRINDKYWLLSQRDINNDY